MASFLLLGRCSGDWVRSMLAAGESVVPSMGSLEIGPQFHLSLWPTRP